MRFLSALLVSIAVFTIGTRVEAAGFPAVQWEGPDDCPDEAEVREVITLWLAQSSDVVDASAIEVDGQVRAQNNGFLLELSLDSPSGSTSQRMTAASCTTLVDAVALYVALAAGPSGVLNSIEQKAELTSQKIGLGARLNGGMAVEQLPGLAFTASLLGSLQFPLWRVEAGLGYALPRMTYYPGIQDVGVEVRLFYGTTRVCARTNVHAVELPICIGIELGMMRGEGQGVEEHYTSDQFWGALVLGPALRAPLGSGLWAWLEADAIFALFRPHFFMRNLDDIYRPQSAATRARLGIEWQYF